MCIRDSLRSRGVEVTENVLREECDALNRIFFRYITTGRPFVSMKYAMTMDGKIAAFTGASKWVTGETARSHVQRQRHRFRGIMVGVGTVLADDPLLTCRKMCIRDRHWKHWLFAQPCGIISHREPRGADKKNSVYFTCASEQLQQKQAVCVF